MNLAWHSGIKKIGYMVLMAIGAWLSLKMPDVFGNFKFDELVPSILTALDGLFIAGSAASLAIEAKTDKKAEAERVNSLVTTDKLDVAIATREPQFDPTLFHYTVLLPLAKVDKVQNSRQNLASAAYYVAESRLKSDTPQRIAYILGLAKGAFHSIVGMTWEQAIAHVPQWAATCQGSTLRAAMQQKLAWYYIFIDVESLMSKYYALPPELRPEIFDPQWSAEDIGLKLAAPEP
jgi:hypothetical protein